MSPTDPVDAPRALAWTRHLVAVAAVVLLASAVLGLASREDAAPIGPATPGQVSIAEFVFAPGTASVRVGSTLTWTNEDDAPHTVNADDKDLRSGSIAKGEGFEHTFDEPGTYAYYCSFHPFMKGIVEVTQ